MDEAINGWSNGGMGECSHDRWMQGGINGMTSEVDCVSK